MAFFIYRAQRHSSLQQWVANSWAVYKFPRLCPISPPAGAERGPGAPWCTARVFQRGHHFIGPAAAGEAAACCQCINLLQKLLAVASPLADCDCLVVSSWIVIIGHAKKKCLQLLRSPAIPVRRYGASAVGQPDEARQQKGRPPRSHAAVGGGGMRLGRSRLMLSSWPFCPSDRDDGEASPMKWWY